MLFQHRIMIMLSCQAKAGCDIGSNSLTWCVPIPSSGGMFGPMPDCHDNPWFSYLLLFIMFTSNTLFSILWCWRTIHARDTTLWPFHFRTPTADSSSVRTSHDSFLDVPARKINLLSRPFVLGWRDKNKVFTYNFFFWGLDSLYCRKHYLLILLFYSKLVVEKNNAAYHNRTSITRSCKFNNVRHSALR